MFILPNNANGCTLFRFLYICTALSEIIKAGSVHIHNKHIHFWNNIVYADRVDLLKYSYKTDYLTYSRRKQIWHVTWNILGIYICAEIYLVYNCIRICQFASNVFRKTGHTYFFWNKKIQFTSRLNILNQFLHLVMHIKWTEFIRCKQLLVAGCNNDLAGWLIFLEDKRTKWNFANVIYINFSVTSFWTLICRNALLMLT